jgi:hypothetical protein
MMADGRIFLDDSDDRIVLADRITCSKTSSWICWEVLSCIGRNSYWIAWFLDMFGSLSCHGSEYPTLFLDFSGKVSYNPTKKGFVFGSTPVTN